MFLKPKKRRPRNNQSITHWIILAIVVLGIIRHMTHPESPLLQTGGPIDKAVSKLGEGNPLDFKNMKHQFLPVTIPSLKIQDIEPGEGTSALCGQKVSIAYKAYLDDNTEIGDSASKDKPLIFTIGEGKVIPVLEQGISGMKKGGKRNLFSPPDIAYDAKDFSRSDVPSNTPVHFETELLDITPSLPDLADTPYRVLDIQNGFGHTMSCGSPASVMITVWGMDGKKLFPLAHDTTRKIDFIPGKSQVFIGLEQAVLGMHANGKRTVIVPPVLQKTLNGKTSIVDIPFPENQTVLVDIESVP